MGYPGARDYGGDNPLLRCAALPFGSHPRPCRDLSARRDAGADAAPVKATAGAGSRGDVRRIAQAAARAQFALSAPGPHPADRRANAVKAVVARTGRQSLTNSGPASCTTQQERATVPTTR